MNEPTEQQMFYKWLNSGYRLKISRHSYDAARGYPGYIKIECDECGHTCQDEHFYFALIKFEHDCGVE